MQKENGGFNALGHEYTNVHERMMNFISQLSEKQNHREII